MKYKIILFTIVLLAAVLRFWQLGSTPPSPNWDEVALAYNAHSILETGRDEYGKFMPIVLQSFNDYKPALYTYLVIPFLLIFDISVVAVRLPSAVFGLIAVLATYFLIKELLSLKDTNNQHKPKKTVTSESSNILKGNWIEHIALLSALFLAISPWHIQFSRISFESNVALTFVILMFYFFIKGLKNPSFLMLSTASAAITFYLYQSAKVFTPLFFLALVLIFSRDLLRLPKKWLVVAVVIGLIVISPMAVFILTTPDALIRAQGLSIVHHDPVQLLLQTSQRLVVDQQRGDLLGLLFDNRRIVFAKSILSGYLTHFNPNWMLMIGDSPRHHAPFMGMIYLFEFPLILLGIYTFIFAKIRRGIKLAVFAQLFITPIAASVTFDIPSAVRTLNFLPTFQIFAAFGTIALFYMIRSIRPLFPFLQSLQTRVFTGIVVSVITLAVFLNMAYYLNQYFVQQNYFYSSAWQYGYEEVVREVTKIEDQYDRVIIESRPPMDQSYMFFLYYLKFPPDVYQKHSRENISGSFDAGHAFGKYEFREIDWKNEERKENILYVGTPKYLPTTIRPLHEVSFLDGEKAYIIFRGNTEQ
jgi:4-amino-4-deoxy-L-arabinose transferase-like glycosyltransferase